MDHWDNSPLNPCNFTHDEIDEKPSRREIYRVRRMLHRFKLNLANKR